MSGTTNPTSTLGKNGDTYINTSTWDVYVKSGGNWTKVGNILGTKGADGLTPHIGNNGNWWIGTTDTNVPATGPAGSNGTNGTNGQTPHIGNNGNWWIGETDTGVKAALTINTLTVTFKPENGQANFTQQVNQYHLVTKPTNPTKADHQFMGWFTDLDEQWVFSGYPLTQNLTLNAKYQIVEAGTEGLIYSPIYISGIQNYIVSGYEGVSTEVVIPRIFNNKEVIGVGYLAFTMKPITSIVLPSSIIFIGDSAFALTKLVSINLPIGLDRIGRFAFEIPTLTNISLPNSLTSIGEFAFGYTNLSTIEIPSSVNYIGEGAFSSRLLMTIYAELSTKPNGWDIYWDYNWATQQSGTNKVIWNYKNHETEGLIYYNYTRDGKIEYYVSDYIGNETDVVIPSTKDGFEVTGIGNATFQSKNLTSVRIPNSVMVIGYNAFSKNQLTFVIIPNSVIFIGNSAFRVNPLSLVIIGDNVTTIEDYAFQQNHLKSITIPDSVTTIGESAFTSTHALTIYVEAAVIPEGWNQNWFYSQNGSVTVIWDYKNQN
jgi:hypothetical protein